MPQPRVTGSCLKQGPGRCRRVRGAARRRLGTSSKPQPHICVGTAGASSLLPNLTAPRPADSHSTAGWPRPHAGEATARESLHGTGKGHAHPGPSRVRHVREVPVHCRGGSQSPPQLRPSHTSAPFLCLSACVSLLANPHTLVNPSAAQALSSHPSIKITSLHPLLHLNIALFYSALLINPWLFIHRHHAYQTRATDPVLHLKHITA